MASRREDAARAATSSMSLRPNPPPSVPSSAASSSSSSSIVSTERSVANRPRGPSGLHLALQCFSFACVGKEASADKIVLPHEALKEVSRLRLPFPLLFTVENAKTARLKAAQPAAVAAKKEEFSQQCCGVLEFSAPDGVVWLPGWIMNNIDVDEGGFVLVKSCPPLLRGKFARFQPETSAFDNALKASGMRPFLESTLRHFSVLSKGQRIELTHNGHTYGLRVLHTEPANTISILGGTDLEVEFTPPLDTLYGTTASSWTDRGKDKTAPSLPEPIGEHKDPPAATATAAATAGGTPMREKISIRGDEDEDELLRKVMAMSLADAGIHDDDDEPSVPSQPRRSQSLTMATTDAKLQPADALIFHDGNKFDRESDVWRIRQGVTPQALADERERDALEREEKDRLQKAVDEANDPWKIRSDASAAPAAAAPSAATPTAVAPTGLAARTGGNQLSATTEETKGPVVVGADEKLCSTCNRAVPLRTFTMHSLQCARAQQRAAAQPSNVAAVATPVAPPTTRPVKCLLCTKELGSVSLTADDDTIADEESDLRQSHNPTCERRPVCCVICKKFFPLIDSSAHTQACGDRMEKCMDCGNDVTLRHLFTFSSSTPPFVSPIPLLIPWPPGPHAPSCVPKQETCSACKATMPLRLFANHKSSVCPHRSEECPFCFLSFPLSHQEYCGSRTAPCDTCGRYITLRLMAQHVSSKCTYPAPTVSTSNNNNNNLDDSVELSPRAMEEKDRRMALMMSLGLDRSSSPPRLGALSSAALADAAPGGRSRIPASASDYGDMDDDAILRSMRERVDELERANARRDRIDRKLAENDPDLFSALLASAAPPNGNGSNSGASTVAMTPAQSAHALRLAERLEEEEEYKRRHHAPAATRTVGGGHNSTSIRDRDRREQLETAQVLAEQREADRRAAAAIAALHGTSITATRTTGATLNPAADRVREAREAASHASRTGARSNALAQPTPAVGSSVSGIGGRTSPNHGAAAHRRVSPAPPIGARRASSDVDSDLDSDDDSAVLRRAIQLSRADGTNRATGGGAAATRAPVAHPSGMPRRSPPPAAAATSTRTTAGTELRRRPTATPANNPSSSAAVPPASNSNHGGMNPTSSFAALPPPAVDGRNECTYCGANTGTYEDLQMHVFTACPVYLHSMSNESQNGSAVTPAPSAAASSSSVSSSRMTPSSTSTTRRPVAASSSLSSSSQQQAPHRRVIDLTEDESDGSDYEASDDDGDAAADRGRVVTTLRRAPHPSTTTTVPAAARTTTATRPSAAPSVATSSYGGMTQLRAPPAATATSATNNSGYYTSVLNNSSSLTPSVASRGSPVTSSSTPSSASSSLSSTRTTNPSSSSSPSYPSYSIVPPSSSSTISAARFNFPPSAEVSAAGRGTSLTSNTRTTVPSSSVGPRAAERSVGSNGSGRQSQSSNNPFDNMSPILGNDGYYSSVSPSYGLPSPTPPTIPSSTRRGVDSSAAGTGATAARTLNHYDNPSASVSSAAVPSSRVSRFSFDDDLDLQPSRQSATSAAVPSSRHTVATSSSSGATAKPRAAAPSSSSSSSTTATRSTRGGGNNDDGKTGGRVMYTAARTGATRTTAASGTRSSSTAAATQNSPDRPSAARGSTVRSSSSSTVPSSRPSAPVAHPAAGTRRAVVRH